MNETVEQKEIQPTGTVAISMQTAGALLLFLLTFWYFYSFGATDLALAPPFDDYYPFLMAIPYLCCPLFILVINRLGSRALQSVKFVLIITATAIFMIDLWITAANPVFSSRWTWAYNDLRELNYLAPALNVAGYVATACLLFLSCYEFLVTNKYTSANQSASFIIRGIGIVLLGFVGFGICQEIIARQPIWVSLTIIAWLTVMECVFIMISSLHSWRLVKSHKRDEDDREFEPRLTLKERLQIKPFKGYIFIGLAIWCFFVALYPAQLAFQEGPSNPWGTSVLVGAATGALLLALWWHFKLPPLASFLTVAIVAAISPTLLALDASIVPGIVPAAQTFSLAGFVSTLIWILYCGNQNRDRWSAKHTMLALWMWGAFFVVFFHDPLLEVWEMEEALLKLQIKAGVVTDPFGTGVGLYYPVLLMIALIGIACASILLLLETLIKKAKKDCTISLQGARSHVLESKPSSSNRSSRIPLTPVVVRKTQFYASLAILIVAFSCSLVLTQSNVTTNAPVVVAEMGDHGALWLANSYDRVIPDYHPDFAASPRNSTIAIHAMKGEAELVQLVFSPLASKMISFNGYQWSSSAGATGDNRWLQDNGTLVQIPITTGQVGYLNCFSPRIADVILPWKSFITGSEARENVPFWLEVSVPRNVSAGMYSTQFEYMTTSYLQRVARAASLKFTLQLTVWNVTKPMNRTVDTVIGLWPENAENADKLLKLGMKYGVDPYTIGIDMSGQYRPVGPDDYNPENLSEGIHFNWSRFDARVQEMLDAGLNQIKLDFYPGINCRSDAEAVLNGSMDNYLTLIRWFYENASAHLASKITPWGTTWESETITQHSDEPDPRIDPQSPAAFDLVYRIVHNASSGKIRSFQTFMYEPAFDEWLDSLDIWVLTPDSFTPGVSALIHGAGHEVWTYSNGDNFPGTDTDLRTPLIMSRLRGWVDYNYNISGFLHWVFFWNYNDAGRSGCGYDGRGDGTEIVPHEDGYVPTLRLAAFRDGLEDNELLWALNKSIARAQDLSIGDPVLNEAISVLQSVNAAMGRQSADTQWPIPVVTREFDHAASTYMDLRLKCGTVLEKLIALL